MKSSKEHAKPRVLMLVENAFPKDGRVRNEAFTLSSKGLAVSVIALGCPGEKLFESVENVTVYRLPRLTLFKKLPRAQRSRVKALANKASVLVGYTTEYLYFTLASALLSCFIALRKGFDVIHAHNPPDTLFIIGAIHKLFGRKFVFDHHDLSPELYRSRYTTQKGLICRTLASCEKASVRLADVVIETNESYRAIDIARNGAEPSKVVVVRNGPDLTRVRSVAPDLALRGKARVLLGYVGAINPQDGIDYMLRALSHLHHNLGRSDFHCIVIGEGDSLNDMKTLTAGLGLADHVEFTGFIPDKDMLRYLSTVDICLDPNPSSPLNDVSTWIKVMEYMALGKPIVSFDLKETRVSAGNAALYATPNDEKEFALGIATLMDNESLRTTMGQVGLDRVKRSLNWEVSANNLVAAYRRLFQAWLPQAGSETQVAHLKP